MANKPYFENRAGTDVAGLQSALVRYFQQLQLFLDQNIAGDTTAVQADVVALEGRLKTDGGVLSMVGPLGASTPVAAYDFTRFDSTLSIAQNLTNANIAGNSNLNLVALGTGQIQLQASGDLGTNQVPYGISPMAGRVDGGVLLGGAGGANYALTTIASSEFQLLGAMTAEWFGYMPTAPGAGGDAFMFFASAAGETEAANLCYALVWRGVSTSWSYVHENGAGVDDEVVLLNSTLADLADMQSTPTQLAITRTAAGNLILYINGRAATSGVIVAAPNALPTGGTTARLSIGVGSDPAVRIATLGFRLFNTVLTPAQIRESYMRTMFGVGAEA